MKNVKLNLKKARKAGFSLVEMLVVIAVIGIIAAIAIPNIGTINDSARVAAANRNAQSVASVLNAAVSAGVDTSGWLDGDILSRAEAGVAPSDGPFDGKTFTVGSIDDDEEALINSRILWDATNKQVKYTPSDTL